MLLLALVWSVAAVAQQPFFLAANQNPEFASFSSAALEKWCANGCGTVGAENIFGSGGSIGRVAYSAAQDVWAIVASGALASLCWSSDGVTFPGGGAPPQCSNSAGNLNDLAYR
jgi:hypothetical protein